MNILYDLDGTISDPIEGIGNCLNYALKKLGCKEREIESLSKYIGPSLSVAFSNLLKTKDEDELAEAIRFYRERYIPIGFKENTLYPKIDQILAAANDCGIRQFIATSKRKDIAESVINHFELGGFIEGVYGCDLGRTKTELIKEILHKEVLERENTMMIGDRSFDILAGKENGLRTIGVLWGYGSRQELEDAGASTILETMEELEKTILPNKSVVTIPEASPPTS